MLLEETVVAVAQSMHNICAVLVFENGITIKCTLDHPLYIEGKEWCAVSVNGCNEMYDIKVAQLEVGDFCLLLEDDKIMSTKLISISKIKCSETFYCISTERYHNFFANCFLAHDVNIDRFQLDFLSQECVIVNRL